MDISVKAKPGPDDVVVVTVPDRISDQTHKAIIKQVSDEFGLTANQKVVVLSGGVTLDIIRGTNGTAVDIGAIARNAGDAVTMAAENVKDVAAGFFKRAKGKIRDALTD